MIWARRLTLIGTILLMWAVLTLLAYAFMGPDGVLAVYLGILVSVGLLLFWGLRTLVLLILRRRRST
jgi:hypothetical protein